MGTHRRLGISLEHRGGTCPACTHPWAPQLGCPVGADVIPMVLSCITGPKKTLSEAARAGVAVIVEQVTELYRGPTTCLLVDAAGEVWFESAPPGGVGPRVDMTTLEHVCVLKRGLLRMADGLTGERTGGGRAPAVHLKGDGSVVSCFDAGDEHLLVVVAEMHATSAELLDTSKVEAVLGDALGALAETLARGAYDT